MLVDSFSSYDTVDIKALSFDEPESPRHTTVSNKKTIQFNQEIKLMQLVKSLLIYILLENIRERFLKNF